MDAERARDAGREAVLSFHGMLRRSLAELLKRDPDRLAGAVEMGLVRHEWLEDPAGEPISTAAPMEVIERFLERTVEQRPSVLASMGLSAIQVLGWRGEEEGGEGSPTRLAVAFTDLVGFTEFTSTSGDEAASHLLVDHHRVVGPVVRARGGRVVKRLGDGLLLTFPEPEAAVLACLEMVRVPPEPLTLRAGVHVGEVLAQRDDIVGHVVNVAARVAESAQGGEVLVTTDVADDVDGLPGASFGRPKRRGFKGLGEPVGVLRVQPG
jgi:adenylate cyclase